MSHGRFILTFVLAFGASLSARASTVVGNGGDVVERYLEATRFILEEANANIQSGKDVSTLCTCTDTTATDPSCVLLRGLTADQQAFCAQALTATSGSVTSLNTGASPVAFTVSTDPLYVQDAAGNQVEVSAETDAGPGGPVVFSYDDAQTMSPMQLLALMAGQFSDKADYPTAGQYISMTAPVGPFATADGGSQLLAAMGAAVAWYSYQEKLVGIEFTLMDNFSCDITEQATGIDFSTEGTTARLFADATNTGIYTTGVGNWPTDLQCSLNETEGSQLFYHVLIHEETGCGTDGTGTRYTVLELWRITDPVPPSTSDTEVLLQSTQIPGWNPLCTVTPPPAPAGTTPAPAAPAMSLNYQDTARSYNFTVQYEGSSGRAGPEATQTR